MPAAGAPSSLASGGPSVTWAFVEPAASRVAGGFGALARELEAFSAFCANLDRYLAAESSVEDLLALGATACPEGGQVVPALAVGGDLERVNAMISGAEARLGAAKAEVARLSALLANGGDDLPGFDTAPPADGQDRSAPRAGFDTAPPADAGRTG